jgi:NAD(P)-dependent dehydrogenase (short-subunit alcohol dehydrogenase family)
VVASSRLSGVHAIVTGAAGGIGLAIAEAFAAAGARVLLTDIRATHGRAACESIGAAATFRRLDVTHEGEWADLTRALEGDPPDVLVNNAGGLIDSRPLHEAPLDTWTRTIELNLTSVFLGMRAVLPLMLERRRGSIVNVCSVSGIAGQPDAPAYQAAKAGALLLTRNAAVTYGPAGIRINALTPSVVETPGLGRESDDRTASFLAKVPLGRAATAAEVASGAVYLASDESSYVNGANLVIDGGYLA